MASKHRLTCECGKEHPVETFDAGRSLVCVCGKTLKIPSMLHIKKLPLWQESGEEALNAEEAKKTNQTPNPEAQGSKTAPGTAPKTLSDNADLREQDSAQPKSARKLTGSRLGLFIVGLGLVLLFGFLLFRTIQHFPHPAEVFWKQREFIHDGMVVRRDSLPLEPEDFAFYFNDQLVPGQWAMINDQLIDSGEMSPFMLTEYFNAIKSGPKLSDNFYENYEILKTNFWMKIVLYSLLLVLSAVVCLLAWLLPKKQVIVGTMRGAEWKA